MNFFGRLINKNKAENPDNPELSSVTSPDNDASQATSTSSLAEAVAPHEEAQPSLPVETTEAALTEKSSGLKGVWESTKKLALTPVDPWFAKMAGGLDKTRRQLLGQIGDLFRMYPKIDEDFWDELEAILLTADVGVASSQVILEGLKKAVKEKKLSQPQELTDELKAILTAMVTANGDHVSRRLNIEKGRLNVVMMVGVNGTGKTTTTAKLASLYKKSGYKVLLAAADTFRAAAIDQLQVWADRIGVDLVRHQEGSDPAAVVYDAIQAGRARGCDIVFVDTAGRLHNKANLMEELRKIRRVADKNEPGAPHETLLVLDATTGQNAMSQARAFHSVTELTGLVMCKLDGTGKGGIILSIGQEFGIPVKYIGIGEAVDDLREFSPQQFVDALFAAPGSIVEGEASAEEAVPEA